MDRVESERRIDELLAGAGDIESFILGMSRESWNRWLSRSRESGDGLKWAVERLRGSTLTDQDFSGRFLWHADCAGAAIQGVSFKGCNLRGAKFGRARLKDVDFGGALLLGVDFSEAALEGVSFVGATIFNCTFETCRMRRMRFAKATICERSLATIRSGSPRILFAQFKARLARRRSAASQAV